MSVVDAFAVQTQRSLDAMIVELDHLFLNAELACDWPGPCLMCRWYSTRFLNMLEVGA